MSYSDFWNGRIEAIVIVHVGSHGGVNHVYAWNSTDKNWKLAEDKFKQLVLIMADENGLPEPTEDEMKDFLEDGYYAVADENNEHYVQDSGEMVTIGYSE